MGGGSPGAGPGLLGGRSGRGIGRALGASVRLSSEVRLLSGAGTGEGSSWCVEGQGAAQKQAAPGADPEMDCSRLGDDKDSSRETGMQWRLVSLGEAGRPRWCRARCVEGPGGSGKSPECSCWRPGEVTIPARPQRRWEACG